MTVVGEISTLYREFIIEDESDRDISDGFHVNLDPTTNAQAVSRTAGVVALPGGSLLPGNLVMVDTALTPYDPTRPPVRRPTNIRDVKGLTTPVSAPTFVDQGGAGTWQAVAYTAFYVLKNGTGQITGRSAVTAPVTPVVNHAMNVTIPVAGGDAGNLDATSADVYAASPTLDYRFVGNILVANFGATQTFAAPPSAASAPAPTANVNGTNGQINDLANAQLGLIFGYPHLTYMPTDGAFRNGVMVTVKRGEFTALLDKNSFEQGFEPTAVKDKVYPGNGGNVNELGKLSTRPVGTAASPSVQVGTVVGFAVATGPGNAGVQITVTPTLGPPVQGTAGLVGGTNLVRVRFRFPFVPWL